MTSTGKFGDGNFETDLRAAMAPVPASANLKRDILLLPLEYPRLSHTERAAMRLPWYASALKPMSLGSFAAAASLALGIYAGFGGFWGQTQTADEVDLAGLVYDPATSLGDM